MSVLRRVLGLGVTLAISLVLAACTLSSDTDLIATDTLVTPLPAHFSMFPFKLDGADYAPTDDAPIDYALDGSAYIAGDRSMTIRFAPLGDDTYLIAASGADLGALYGTIRIDADVVAIRMVFGDGLATAIEAAMATAPAAIVADIAVVDGGIKVGRRETLDYVIGLIEAGALPTSPLVAWIGSDGNARPPARIIADGDRFKAGG
ncbi:MAG: hypothetical protein IPK28_18000 [Devosia sp.]|nr:hypothetical protein [Devosia sp.]